MLSREKEFLERAERSIKNKNCDEFLMNIASAEALVVDTDTLSDILYVKAKGLFIFRKYGSAVTAIEVALKSVRDHNKVFKLLKAKALILAFKGHYRDSLRLFKEMLTKTEDNVLLTEVYTHIARVMLEEYKREQNDAVINEIKIYLDTAYEMADELDDSQKKRLIFTNYAEYFKLKNDFEMAIEMLEQVIPLCTERELCEINNDLAELYMEQGNEELMEKYVRAAELLASKIDNEVEVARALYTLARGRMRKGDYIRVMDSLCIAFYNFINCGMYNYAYDCFTKINEASEALKHDCSIALQEQFKIMFVDTAYKDLI